MKNLFVNVKCGPESLMKIVGLARRKGIEIRDISMSEKNNSEYELKMNYCEPKKTNFISLVSEFEDVFMVN